MERLFLYVPPEEYPAAEAAGAVWDEASKRWSIAAGDATAPFARWLDEDVEPAFQLTSDQAFVAATRSICEGCGKSSDVICIYGASGMDLETDGWLSDVTVSHIWAMDEGLARQLKAWPGFHWVADEEDGYYANHCPHCGVVREDARLHSEPGDVFFGLSGERPGLVNFTPLEGRVWLSGDYSFGV